MHIINLPQAVKTMQSGTVRRWLCAEGDRVTPGQVLVEIESDEGLIEIESANVGTLRDILVPAGKTVPINTPLAHITEARDAPTADNQQAGTPVGGSATENGNSNSNSTTTMESNQKPSPAPVTASPPPPASAVIPILMPQAGQSMEEGTIAKWHVQPGDSITKGQVIFDVETDKATVEVEATDAGRLARIVLGEGETLAVLEPVAFLAENDADVDAYLSSQGITPTTATQPAPTTEASKAQGSAPTETAAPAPISNNGRAKASPAARKMAAEQGVDLGAVGAGRGPNGRILSSDVMQAATTQPKPASQPVTQPTAPQVAPVSSVPGEVIRHKLTPMRRAIAINLQASKQTVPHFYMRMTCEASALVSFYQGEKAKYPCSINDVITLACAKVIQEMPAFRSRIEETEILEFPDVNIGIAVGLEQGLVVPVIRGVERMTLQQLGGEARRIVTNARNGKIEGMGHGVFTISNMGMFGVEEFAAIINPPESAILAVGAVREEVIVSGGTMRPGRVMTMTLSVDHRVVDGVLAAKFMARLKEILEYPAQLV